MSEPNHQNYILEHVSRSGAGKDDSKLDHISLSAGEVMRKLGQLPRQMDKEPVCKRCDGTMAITRKIRGMVYECACSCAANY